MTYERVLEAVKRYFNDTSRSHAETKSGLNDLREEIDMLIDALDEHGETEGDDE